MEQIPVLAAKLCEEHLLVIDGQVGDIVRVLDLSGYPDYLERIRVEFVPQGAPLNTPVLSRDYEPHDVVPCVRRAEWAVSEVAR